MARVQNEMDPSFLDYFKQCIEPDIHVLGISTKRGGVQFSHFLIFNFSPSKIFDSFFPLFCNSVPGKWELQKHHAVDSFNGITTNISEGFNNLFKLLQQRKDDLLATYASLQCEPDAALVATQAPATRSAPTQARGRKPAGTQRLK